MARRALRCEWYLLQIRETGNGNQLVVYSGGANVHVSRNRVHWLRPKLQKKNKYMCVDQRLILGVAFTEQNGPCYGLALY